MLRLLSHRTVPPGGFYYLQTEGIRKGFSQTPEIGSLANRVAAFRKANGLARADKASALQDIDEFTAARLGVGRWTVETNRDYMLEHPEAGPPGGCRTCGIPTN